MLCIVINTATTLTSTLFTRTLIDDYIVPLTLSENPISLHLPTRSSPLAAGLIVGIGSAPIFTTD